MERKNAWLKYDAKTLEAVEATAKRYRAFLDAGKTERECVDYIIAEAQRNGYTDLKAAIASGKRLNAGDKVYMDCMGKSVMLFYVGRQPLEKGLNILGAHIDSPRIDLKQNPFYEDGDFAYADTHYYGGIKKYLYLTRNLALHGVVAKKDGTVVKIAIGENEDDPVFGISDAPIHLSHESGAKPANDLVNGEGLDIIMAGRPLAGEEKEPVKAALLQILKEKYGIEEDDMISAEIEAVPAGKSRDFGLDRSMIVGYGHDDRVCAFAEMAALYDIHETPEYTLCCVMADKEEIGSVGATGMRAQYFENAVAEMINLTAPAYNELLLHRALRASRMISSDVSFGYDPMFASCYERKNTAFLGKGITFNKYTGSRGKSGSNDANAEYIGRLRRIMDENDVSWQTAECGRVDVGGGGTIAYICALYGMEVIDSGVPVLSMHAPEEVIDKADLYESVKAYNAFLREA